MADRGREVYGRIASGTSMPVLLLPQGEAGRGGFVTNSIEVGWGCESLVIEQGSYSTDLPGWRAWRGVGARDKKRQ